MKLHNPFQEIPANGTPQNHTNETSTTITRI